MAKKNSELSVVWGKLLCSRPGVLFRSLEGHEHVTVAEVADAAMDLGLGGCTVGAVVRALRDGEVITFEDYDLAAAEKRIVSTALSYVHERSGSLADAAAELGVTVPILQGHMRRHGLRADGTPTGGHDV